MSMLDKIRQKQGLPPRQVAEMVLPGGDEPRPEPIQEPTTDPVPKKPKKQKQPNLPAKQTVTYACGCATTVKHIEGNNCPSCASKTRQEKTRHQNEQRLSKSRLPDGSTFHAVYDAAKVLWTCTLTLASGQVFTIEGGSLSYVHHTLDEQYRTWAATQTA